MAVGPRYEGEHLVGPDGGVWHEVAEWLEPDEVVSLVGGGAIVAVDRCESWSWDSGLDDEVMRDVVSIAESHRRARGKYPDSVIMRASLWNEEGSTRSLVLLSEEAPKRRSVLKGFSRLVTASLSSVSEFIRAADDLNLPPG